MRRPFCRLEVCRLHVERDATDDEDWSAEWELACAARIRAEAQREEILSLEHRISALEDRMLQQEQALRHTVTSLVEHIEKTDAACPQEIVQCCMQCASLPPRLRIVRDSEE